MTLRIFTIVGARPQFIKAAILSRNLKSVQNIEETLIHTGQHFDDNMSEIFFEELKIPKPAYRLNIQGGSHAQMTAQMLEAIEEIFRSGNPDAALVYGDTNSTLAGALAAAKLRIPIIHVEAGLRSYNRAMPEEVNRVITDHLSSYLCCSTKVSIENLKKEGIVNEVHNVGDIMYDATMYAMECIKEDFSLCRKLSYLPKNFAFMTVHRSESTEDSKDFKAIIDYAKQFSEDHDLKIVFPVHPRTKHLINQELENLNKFIFSEPLSYFETQYCLSKASYVLTDSGGLQKEAYFHRVPCVTLRKETEWVETIAHGWNRLWTVDHYQFRKDIMDYGDGKAADKIVSVLNRIQ